jgi:transposase
MATDLTNTQWEIVRHLIPERERTGSRGGRPWREPREVLNGILWVLRTGARWADLPRRYPPPQTCHRRFQKWTREGVLDAVLRALADDLRERAGDAWEPVAPTADLAGPVLLWPMTRPRSSSPPPGGCKPWAGCWSLPGRANAPGFDGPPPPEGRERGVHPRVRRPRTRA